MEIKERLVRYNFSSRNNTPIKYIVVHDTGNTRKGSNADAHYNYFNNADRQSSAHYFIDDEQILRIINDSDKSWHCGDGKGKYGITNENSLGIEMCINSDGDFEKTKQNTLKLIRHLMEKYNIDFKNIVRHYDASRKVCPYSMSKNNWEDWDKFKEDIQTYIEREYKDYSCSLKLLYINIFGREGDEEGINYWNRKLNEGYNFGDVLKEFGESEEFKEKYII